MKGMVSRGSEPTTVKFVAYASAIQADVAPPRVSETATAPNWPLIVPPGAPSPRSADVGASMSRLPRSRRT